MDSIRRQDQNPNHHHQQQRQQPVQQQQEDHPNRNIGSAPFQYSNNNSNQHDDAFNTFFNVDGPSGFDSTWGESSAIIDPRLQTNGYTPSPGPWQQNPLQNQGGGLVSNEYANAFTHNPNLYNFPGYNASQFQAYPSNTFDPTLPYSNGPMLGASSFQDPDSEAYGPSTSSTQGQTISPSALQTYPNHYAQIAAHLEQPVSDTMVILKIIRSTHMN